MKMRDAGMSTGYIGARRDHGSSVRAITATVGALAACVVAVSVMSVTVRRIAQREADREAELDVWAYSGVPDGSS